MAFDTFESAQETSEPVELYTFTIGAVITRVTSAEDDFTEGVDTFTAVSIKREKLIGGGPDKRGQNLVLTVPGDNSIAIQYINSVPGVKADVRIERVQRPDGPSFEVITIFEGRIAAVAFEEEGRQAKIDVVPLVSAVSRPVPRFEYMGLCNHVLYDVRCGVDDTDPVFRLSSALVTAESDRTITVTGADGFGNGYYTGGFVESAGAADRRLILEQTGTLLTLTLPFAAAVLNTNVTVFAGCDHTIQVCKSKFNIVINFGGFAFVPTKNIFQTGLSL